MSKPESIGAGLCATLASFATDDGLGMQEGKVKVCTIKAEDGRYNVYITVKKEKPSRTGKKLIAGPTRRQTSTK